MADEPVLDPLDLALLTALRRSPRAGILELSRLVRVARATVQSRLERLELIENRGLGQDHGAANAWHIAARGLELVRSTKGIPMGR